MNNNPVNIPVTRPSLDDSESITEISFSNSLFYKIKASEQRGKPENKFIKAEKPGDVIDELGLFNNLYIKELSRVALVCSHPFSIIRAVLWLWKRNITPVILNPTLKTEELKRQIKLSDAEMVIYEGFEGSRLTGIRKRKLPERSVESVHAPGENTICITRQITGAVILFTSGTTGAKPVLISSVQLETAFRNGARYFNYLPNETWLLSLPLYHISGFSILYRALRARQKILIPQDSSIQILANAIRKYHIDYLSLVPTQIIRLLKTPAGLRRIKAILIGGAEADEKIIRSAVNRGLKIYKVYGSTETAAFFCALSPVEVKLKPRSAGKPLGAGKVYIFNAQGKKLPNGQTGRIGLAGKSVIAAGSSLTPDLKFVRRSYLTGDLGHLDEDGYLFIDGREDDLINSGAKKIFPSEIEPVIAAFKGVISQAVFGLPHKEWGQAVTAVIQINRNTFKPQKFVQFLKLKLAAYQIPKRIYITDGSLANNLGKISRRRLAEKAIKGEFKELKDFFEGCK